mgnify:CR=1 FL=1
MGQQETWRLPDAFVARMKDMLGDECDAFLASYEKERALGLRVNTLKVPAAEFAEKKPGSIFPASGFLVQRRFILCAGKPSGPSSIS